MPPKLHEEEWEQIATRAKAVRRELFYLKLSSKHRMPADVVNMLDEAIRNLDRYRIQASDIYGQKQNKELSESYETETD